MKKRHSYIVLTALSAAALASCSSLTTEVKQSSSSEPSNIRSVDLPYTSVEASYQGWYAVRTDGTVTRGQFFQNANVPVGLANVKAVSSGGYHTVALKNDGTVVAWGTPAAGIDTTNATFVPAGLNNVTQVSAGFNQTLALKSDGTVSGWGDPIYGVVAPEAASDVVAISAGGGHNLALKSNGQVIVWGSNAGEAVSGRIESFEQSSTTGLYTLVSQNCVLRFDNESDPACFSSFENGPGLQQALDGVGTLVAQGPSDVKAISAGGSFSVALKNSGALVSWGSITNTPVGSNFTAIAAGGLHSKQTVR
jgi:alpha-tubulin suppressor-like RCC1 family protein